MTHIKSTKLPFPKIVEPDFQVMQLGFDSLHKVLDLMIKVQDNLKESEKHFLKPQNLQDLRKHVANGFPLIGIVEQNSGVIGGVMLLTPAEKAERGKYMENYPSHLMQSGTGVIQSVCIDPLFEGQGLMKKLLEGAKQVASSENMFRLLAKVSTQNVKSAKGFLRSQFAPVAEAVDVKLGYNATYWEKKIGDGLATADIPLFNSPHVAIAPTSNIIQFATPERR